MGSTTETEAVPTQPRGRVAPHTHPLELQRLALQEVAHPECRPLRVQALGWLNRAHTAVSAAQAEELRDLGLSPSGLQVLLAILTTEERRLEPRHIAERLMLSRPSVTGLLDTLQDRELVVRRPHGDDRRRVLVELTAKALQLLEGYLGTHYRLQAALLSSLDDDELETLVLLLRKVQGATPADLERLPEGSYDPDAPD